MKTVYKIPALFFLFLWLIPLGLVITLQSQVCAVGKVVQDPNTSAGKAEIESKAGDERLLVKTSCEMGYTRLYKVIADLSEKSRANISCGKNNDDWPVRDVPLVIYANDKCLWVNSCALSLIVPILSSL